MLRFMHRFGTTPQQPAAKVRLAAHTTALEHETSETVRMLATWAQHMERIQPQATRLVTRPVRV